MGKAGRLAANVKRTYAYYKRNGLSAASAAVLERLLLAHEGKGYAYTPPDEAELIFQRAKAEAWENPPLISVAVPAYETPPEYLNALLDSLQAQTWPHWELVVADAGKSPDVETAVKERADERIRYVKLAENRGISENTNEAIRLANGDYIGLLDHDDFLTPDALYEMAAAIRKSQERGIAPVFLYSDEDKCDGDGKIFYEPHRKLDFNPDLLLSNNYVCHFLVMEAGLMKKLKLRSGFDGAQDYDLVLRAAAGCFSCASETESTLSGREAERIPEAAYVHIPKVLYHWRCHTASTASNPESKRYAYEAGRRALEDLAMRLGWRVRVEDTRHLGFYRCIFTEPIWESRPDVGALAGPLPSQNGRLISGIYDRHVPGAGNDRPVPDAPWTDNGGQEPYVPEVGNGRSERCATGTGNDGLDVYVPEAGNGKSEPYAPGTGNDGPDVYAPEVGNGRPEPYVSGAGNSGSEPDALKNVGKMLGRGQNAGSYGRGAALEASGAEVSNCTMRYEGLRRGFGGYLHRAELTQDVEAADIRTLRVRPELEEELQEALKSMQAGAEPVQVSLDFCENIRAAGLRILWDPRFGR